MTHKERDKVFADLHAECDKVHVTKNADYAGKEDVVSNFKEAARLTGLTKYQVWAVYYMKHVASICNSIKANPNAPQVESEPLEGRIVDVINYPRLLQCMLKEDHASALPAGTELPLRVTAADIQKLKQEDWRPADEAPKGINFAVRFHDLNGQTWYGRGHKTHQDRLGGTWGGGFYDNGVEVIFPHAYDANSGRAIGEKQ